MRHRHQTNHKEVERLMELELIVEGHVPGIYALSRMRSGVKQCPALEFMEGMSEASEKSIIKVLQQCVAGGPLSNVQKSRRLDADIFEFKSRQGDRLVYFYHPTRRGIIVITHGFSKGARVRTEIDRALALRRKYLQSLR